MSAALSVNRAADIDTSQIKTFGLAAIVAIAVIGVLISFVVTKIVTRIIVLVVMVVLGFVLYSQRQKVIDDLHNQAKKCEITFFGVHIQPSDPTVKKACAAAASQHK